jgi:hypothetical protein
MSLLGFKYLYEAVRVIMKPKYGTNGQSKTKIRRKREYWN